MNLGVQVLQLVQKVEDLSNALVALRVKVDAMIARQQPQSSQPNQQGQRKVG